MKPLSHDFFFFVFGGVLAAIPALCMVAPSPGLLSPFPIPFLIPVWLLGSLGVGALALLPILFWSWSYQLRGNDSGIPGRSLILAILVTASSLAWTAWSFASGARWQRLTYSWAVASINVAAPCVLAGLFLSNRAVRRWSVAFAFHWLLFAWLGSYAFAYFGETP